MNGEMTIHNSIQFKNAVKSRVCDGWNRGNYSLNRN